MNVDDLLWCYRDRYFFDFSTGEIRDFCHIFLLENKYRNDLINNPNKDICDDEIKSHENAVGLRTEIITTIYEAVLFFEATDIKSLKCLLNTEQQIIADIIDNHVELYNSNNQSDDTDFCNGNVFRNRMRLAEVKARIEELNQTPPIPIEQTKCYKIPIDEEVEYYFHRAERLKEKIKTVSGKYFNEMTEDEIKKIPVSIFDGLDLDISNKPETVTTEQESSQTIEKPANSKTKLLNNR